MGDGINFLKRLLPERSLKKSKIVEETVIEVENERIGIIKLSRIYQHIKLLKKILLLEISQNFQDQLKELHTFFRGDELSPWEKEIEKLNVYHKHQVLALIKGGEINLEKSLQQEFMDELMSLPPLEQFYVSNGNTLELDGALLSLIEGLKQDVKKGNRANFKGIHELEIKFEQLVEQVQADKQEEVRKAVQDMKEQNNSVKNLVLDLFDQLDAVYQAVIQLENEAVTQQVEKVINNSLLKLASYGFEEINVQGEFIDRKTMISLGNVSRQQYAPDLQQYQVYSVHKRGFRDKETKEILRKATVITVD